MRGSITANRLALQLLDPKTTAQAVEEIATALAASEGNASQAAAALEVGHTTMMRWVKQHKELQKALDRARKKRGGPVGGRPRKKA